MLRAALLCILSLHLAASSLEEQFARAERESSAIVPLILAVSRQLAVVSPVEAVVLGDRVQPFCHQLLFDGSLPGEEQLGLITHTVARGEHPTRIAKQYGIDAQAIQLLNPQMVASRLAVGDTLRVLDNRGGSLGLYVWRQQFRLLLLRRSAQGMVLLAFLPCGLGQVGRETPLGASRIVDKVRNPEWRDPDSGVIHPPGSPGNVLGGYWMRVDPGPSNLFSGIGLHGYTGAPASDWIAQPGSRGCVRLLQSDMDVIFRLVPRGTAFVVCP